ncbi:hypothetical protein FOCC_FOCC001230 [Frankliniella occidentalis]|uniref:Uncharacterized protein LOC113206636 isoform X1 n=1 Tax=Frankliniella occidentalis TaxID=133901 RepID=A0A6J1SD13_FRAOC|nr:uncharacterized protein LOC113206636 isoform X1 [Frankliniella occidentalis]XP_026278578.1 uncharacterized protein LOC113206636 isoform X1 [Frankliniella occidentalis]XP_052128741.1 uncharacterized protein LOC113206636 isoform X1 [Frankliniella occidentalis]KAE8752068.1 hypothetical protein FOCC_FOCC001230 [Frankliniella occidentalis]
MSAKTSTVSQSSRLMALLKTLYQAPEKILPESHENKEENNNISGELPNINNYETDCLSQYEENSSGTFNECDGSQQNVEDADKSLIEKDIDFQFYGPGAVFDKYMLEEYIEKDGKLYKTSSLEFKEETVAEERTDTCPFDKYISDSKFEGHKFMLEEYIERNGNCYKTSSLEVKEETVAEEKTDTTCPFEKYISDPKFEDNKYMPEEYIERDGNFYKTSSLKGKEETVAEEKTASCPFEKYISDPKFEDNKYMLEEYIERDGKIYKTSSLEVKEETVDGEKTDTCSFDKYISDPEIEGNTIFTNFLAEECPEEEEEISEASSSEVDEVDEDEVGEVDEDEVDEDEVETDNYLYSDNSLQYGTGNILYDWSQIIKSDEDRNQIYDRWMTDVETWERNRLLWLDEMSQSEGFDSSDYKDRTFLSKVENFPASSNSTLGAESSNTVNMIPVSALQVEKLKPENVKSTDISSVELVNQLDSPEKLDKWYKSQRLRHHKLLHEMGLPNWYEEILQDLSNEDVEVLSVSSTGADCQKYDDDCEEALSAEKAQPSCLSVSCDVVLVYQFTDRHLWRKYHGCWKRSKPEI